MLNGKVLVSLSMYGIFVREKESVLEHLVYANNCSIDDIKVEVVAENI